jgi:hypothetical protein
MKKNEKPKNQKDQDKNETLKVSVSELKNNEFNRVKIRSKLPNTIESNFEIEKNNVTFQSMFSKIFVLIRIFHFKVNELDGNKDRTFKVVFAGDSVI